MIPINKPIFCALVSFWLLAGCSRPALLHGKAVAMEDALVCVEQVFDEEQPSNSGFVNHCDRSVKISVCLFSLAGDNAHHCEHSATFVLPPSSTPGDKDTPQMPSFVKSFLKDKTAMDASLEATKDLAYVEHACFHPWHPVLRYRADGTVPIRKPYACIR